MPSIWGGGAGAWSCVSVLIALRRLSMNVKYNYQIVSIYLLLLTLINIYFILSLLLRDKTQKQRDK